MEIFEMRYFLGVAKYQNIHKASLELNVSPPSLSKAIARLEAELQIKLFERVGRNIKLTNHGHLLMLRSSQIVQLESAARLEIGGSEGQISILLAGPEILLAKFGVEFAQMAKAKYSHGTFEFIACTEEEAINKVKKREAHFALITQDAPSDSKIKNIAETSFVTVASAHHPLARLQKKNKTIPVEKILKYDFVSPNNSILGNVGIKQSLDGWRDDKFQRRISFKSSGLKLIEEVVSAGLALAYLPDYLAESYITSKKWMVLKVVGCPYTCQQKIKLITRSPVDSGWIQQLL